MRSEHWSWHLELCTYWVFAMISILLYAPSSAISQDASATTDTDTLYVTELLLCRDVVEREPVDIVQSYTADDEMAWAFARIYNSGDMTNVTFRWFYEEVEYFTFNSRVGTSKQWRTYSRVTVRPGSWRVEVIDTEGNVIKEARFHVSS